MPAALVPLSLQTIFDQNLERPSPGAKLYFYDAGTTTPKTVYTTSALTVEHSSPVLTNAAGMVPPIYVGVGAYKVRILAPGGVLLAEMDGINGAAEEVVTPETPDFEGFVTGDIVAAYDNTVRPGWVRCNGRTIGSSSSGGTEGTGTSYLALYTHLWNVDANLSVNGGRGASAQADWDANKTIALPDFRGRALFGRASMGSNASGRITTTSTTNPDALGGAGGTETVTLTEAQLAAHDHSITINADGTHQHTGSVANTNNQHNHNMPFPVIGSVAGVTSGSDFNAITALTTVTDVTQDAVAHGHTLALVGDGEHDHTADIADAGGGDAHSNMPPFALVTFYLKV